MPVAPTHNGMRLLPVLGAGGAALVMALLAVRSPALAGALALSTLALALITAWRRDLPRLALGFLGLCLVGYALLGRGFAYLGVPPLYVGELALGLCLLALLLAGRPQELARSWLAWLLGAYLLVGAAATLPYWPLYGLDTLRDAVLWGYGLFALAVAALLLGRSRFPGQGVLEAARRYVRFAPLFLLWTPLAVVLYEVAGSALPHLPGAGVPILDVKGGDVAVHLAGIAGLLLLGLPRLLRPEVRAAPQRWVRQEWLWWGLWLAAAAIPLFRVRGGLLAVALSGLIIVALRPARSRWLKPAALVTLLLTVLLTFNVSVRLGEDRNTISAQSLLLNIQSIGGHTGEGYRDGTRRWRLLWWGDIVNYTFRGPYFWTGKGYGINLADADGYQLGYQPGEQTLRSPHNGHLTILARSGVPGALLWLALQLGFALSLLRAYLRAAAAGQELYARLNLWVLAYWAAFMVNAAFDVYLEGPPGGIWFWSLFGFGLALLEMQRRERLAVPAPPLPTRGTP